MGKVDIVPQSSLTAERATAPRPTAQMVIGCLVIPIAVAIALGFGVFYVWENASTELTVPVTDLLLVRGTPDESAPLLARFGAGEIFHVTGRSEDWRWLEVALWDEQSGWALRPLDILVWQIQAEPTEPKLNTASPQPEPVEELMIEIPGGAFTMGSPPTLGDADESPAHVVKLSPFAIDRTEVTVGRYWMCVKAGNCTAPLGNASQTEQHYLNDPKFDNYPVVHVSWSQAKAYCTSLGKRLPTEAEWEMAAGWDAANGAKVLWPWGNGSDEQLVNADERMADAAPVGTFADDRSPAGVLDMGGNVREWVLDWYKVDYYQLSDDTDPSGPSSRRGEGSGRSVRGGYFGGSLPQARTAERSHEDPEYGYATVGFRCAQDR